ncbi:MAG: succinate dehydrogenase cytochrome b subunit [Muribaculaceae bacterium]|nr:succinate dehydrogenase cytochrome b subunit [Muribaculaceae bacterium]
MWLTSSSIGRKFVMAVTGCALVLLVTFNCLMNTVAILWPAAYNEICMFLGANWYALIASMGLALLFIIHIIYALWLTIQNRAARGEDRYAVTTLPPHVEWSSKNMLVLGIVVLAFLGVHLIQFWAKMQLQEVMGTHCVVDGVAQAPEFGTLFLQLAFNNIWTPIIYIIGFVALWLHMTHGFWSMFHTVGWDNNRWIERLKKIGNAWTTIVVLLFVAQVVAFSIYAKGNKFLTDPACQAQYAQYWSEQAEELNASLMDDVQKASQDAQIYDQDSYMRACMPVFEKYMPKYEQLTAAVNAQCPDAQNEALQSAKQFSQQMQMMVEQYQQSQQLHEMSQPAPAPVVVEEEAVEETVVEE